MKTILAATALVLCTTTAATAAQAPTASVIIGGGPVYNPNEEYILCWFVNYGTVKVTPISQQLFSSGSTTALTASIGCANNSAVAPNQSCAIEYIGAIAPNAESCKITFSGAATNVRGAMQVFDQNSNLLSTVELR
jgi:hypothetical protein